MHKRLVLAGTVVVLGTSVLTGCKSGTATPVATPTPNPLVQTVAIDPCTAVSKAPGLKDWTAKEQPWDKKSTYRVCIFTSPDKKSKLSIWVGGDPGSTSGNKTAYQADLDGYHPASLADVTTYTAGGLTVHGFIGSATTKGPYDKAELNVKGYLVIAQPIANTTPVKQEQVYMDILQAFLNTVAPSSIKAIAPEPH